LTGKIKYFFALNFIFLNIHFYSQNETKKWYFGNQAGLDFMTNPPTVVTGFINTSEGCASIADGGGNLLFYTDGVTIRDQTHNVMANGTGLLGFSSSSQSGIIVKQPGNTNIFYVFTQGATTNGTRYSVVDMSLSSGQGSVTAKNTLIQSPSSEKLTSVKHCNGVDIWVMTHDYLSNVFKAYLVTSAGVNTVPVTSTVGATYTAIDYIGILKFSPNGKKLADALYGSSATYALFDFDNATGIVSNSLVLGSGFTNAYGVEFSPDGTKLYGSRYNNYNIYQWDICAGSGTAIAASLYTVVTSGYSKGALQMASDGKIYVARGGQQALGVINNPNVYGSGCNFVEAGQSIAPKTSQWGLPNFITSSIHPPLTPFTHTVSNSLFGCQTASFTPPPIVNNFTTVSCAASGYSLIGVAWSFGDPASGINNTSSLTNPSHAFTSLGTYTTQLVIYYSCGGGTDTIKQQVIINQPCITVTSTSITCASLGSATVVATGGIGPYSYTWMPGGQVNPVATGLSPGTYTLTVFDFGNNFTYTATATFNSLIPLTGNLSKSSSVTCNGAATATAAVTNITGGSGNQTYVWTNGITTYTLPNPQNLTAGNYTYVVTDALTGCVINAGFFISQPPAMNLNVTASSPTVCAGTSISFTAANSGGVPGPGYTYTWSGGPATSTYAPFHGLSGVYIHTVSSRDGNSCLITATVAANIIANPVINIASASICPLKTGTISALGATSYTWSDNSNGTSLSDNPLVTTTYSLVGAAAGCTSTATGSIVLNSVPVPTLSSNSPVCNNQSLSFNAIGGSSYQWTGPLAFSSSAQNPVVNPATPARTGVYNVTVTAANTCTNTASISVTVNPTPVLAATGSTVCINTAVNLGVNAPAAVSYSWTGPNSFTSASQNPSITIPSVSSSGTYTVKISSAAGCTNSAAANVTVTALPVPLFTTDSPKCKGSMLTFNSTQSTGGVSYSWAGPNGFTYAFSNPLIVNVSVAASGVYTLYLSKGPCTTSTTNTVVIFPLPTPVAANTGPACDTKSLGLSVTGSNVTYTWSGPGGYTSHLQHPHFNAIAAFQAGTYSVVVTDTNSCQNSASTPVIVLSNPVLLTQGARVCYGAQAAISASGAATYTWSGPNGFNSNAAQSFISPALNTSPLTYTVVGSALNTCTSIATALVITKVLPTPTASVTSQACEGQPVYFTGFGGSLYEWSGPLNFYLAKQSFSLTADNAGMSGTYTLKVTDAAGCDGYTTAKLIINHVPAGSLAADKISGCIPFCSGFTFVNADPSPIMASSWQMGNATYTDAAFNYCFVSAGDYLLKGSFTNDKACTSSLSFVIKAYPLPQANFEYFPLEVLENEEVKFVSTSNGENLKSWDWHFRGVNQVKKNAETSYIFSDAGSYPVAMVVKNTWGCSDTIIKVVVVEEDFGFFVPNAFTPNGDDVNEVFVPMNRGVKGYSMMVFNRWGQKLFETSNPGSGWDGTFKGQPCTEDVYTWKIDARSSRDRQKNLTGTVLLYR
jgi:gliding motility-associated-like protein